MLDDQVEADALAAEVRAVAAQFTRRLRSQATTGGLTISQEAVVAMLSQSGPMSSAELARAEKVRPQAMTPTVAALEAAGFVQGSPDPQDRRRTVLSLTESGREALASARAAKQQWLTELLAGTFSAQERCDLRRGLELLRRLASAAPD